TASLRPCAEADSGNMYRPIAPSCVAVFHLAIRDAGMDARRVPMYARRIDTAASRTKMMMAAQRGNRETAVSAMTAAATNTLSDSGSSQAPVRVEEPKRRARYP